MSTRARIWSVGLAATASMVGPLATSGASRPTCIPLALLALGLISLVAEASRVRSIARGPMGRIPPEGARLADGVVEAVAMSGVEGPALPLSPRFRRYTGLVGSAPRAASASRPGPTNPPLLGLAVMISVFVGRDGKGWVDDEIADCLEGLERVGLWVEREAGRRGVPVNLGLADTYFQVEDDRVDPVEVAFSPEGDGVGPLEAGASAKAIAGASRAAARLGFRDVSDLLSRINPRVEADSRAWIFHLRRAGRSLAIPAAESDVDGVGLAVCFSEEASFPEPLRGPGGLDPSTVAHELLHLFGASDKYGVPLRSFPEGSVTPADIMRLGRRPLSRMTVDDLTASEIGWGGPDRPRSKSTKDARR